MALQCVRHVAKKKKKLVLCIKFKSSAHYLLWDDLITSFNICVHKNYLGSQRHLIVPVWDNVHNVKSPLCDISIIIISSSFNMNEN